MEDVRRMARRVAPELAASAPAPAELQQELRAANAILQQLALPWEELFHELEASAGSNVALLSVEPDPQGRQVKISGEAKDLQALFGYMRRLGRSGVLAHVYLAGHAVKDQDPQRPVTFTLAADWTGAS